MVFPPRTSVVLRGFAVFVTAYCVIASGRALIPGLCGTLAQFDDSAACCAPKPACCGSGSAATSTPTVTSVHHGHVCAFCTLVHTAAQPVHSPVAVSVPPTAWPVHIHGSPAPELAEAHDPVLRRGPPALA